MAETLAAVGIASNVLQIVDFGTRVIETTYKLASSTGDALREDIELETLAQEQVAVDERLQASITSSPAFDDNERALVKLSGQCKQESTRLLSLLGELKVSAGSRGFKKSGWFCKGRGPGAKKASRDREPPQEPATDQRTARYNAALEFEVQTPPHLFDNAPDQEQAKASTFERILTENKKDIVAAVLEVQGTIKESIKVCAKKRSKRLQKLIDRLSFPDMQSRKQSITAAFPSTYNWALAQDIAGLTTWLREGSNIYWVSGKAGSGKSTLMKFLGSEPRTRKYLSEWSGGQDSLMLIECFFWYAGSSLQRSIEGLIRTILHRILTCYPGAIPILFPKSWEQTQDEVGDSDEYWSEMELRAALQCIPNAISVAYNNVAPKFCIFIDGLDEYSGNHGELVDTLEKLASSDDTKLCVSSRPWHAFTRAFELRKPHLLLQDLTREDIRHYVDSSIRQALSICQSFGPSETSDNDARLLTSDIVSRAEGVFLWVYLVVQSVLQGLDEGDHITTLRQRVLEFPQDLGKFFDDMLSRVDPVHRHHTAQALYLAYLYVEDEHAADHSSYLDFELLRRNPSGLMEPNYLREIEPQALAPDDFLALARKSQSFLAACCKDLLVVPLSGKDGFDLHHNPSSLKVQFLHRTVYDYLKLTGRLERISEKVPQCLKDGVGLHLLNVAKLHLYPAAVQRPKYHSPVSEYFMRQVSFSLDSTWHGLNLAFVDQMQALQPLYQRKLCASIGSAYIAFKQYSTFRAIYTTPDCVQGSRFVELHKMVWRSSTPFCHRYDFSAQKVPDPQVVISPCPPLVAAALGIGPGNALAPADVDVEFLSDLLRCADLKSSSVMEKGLGIDIIISFLVSALPYYLVADDDGAPILEWFKKDVYGHTEQQIDRILRTIVADGPLLWAEGIKLLYNVPVIPPRRGHVYDSLVRELKARSAVQR